jgi:hypothetical protein
VEASDLAWIAHWTPPAGAPRRFATWFFVGPAPEGAVTIDGGEIHDSAWMSPAEAMARRDDGEVELAPPTWMTLRYLSEFVTVAELMADARARVPDVYETRIGRTEGGLVALWAGDAGYESGDVDAPGPRHRLVMATPTWHLERDLS